MKKNKNILVIALIAIVNALGYGIIIPILYSYSQKFGMTDFQNGLLFSIYSICQFASTPLIGRLSDKYGRKPLLVISLAGTALSFFMAAFAPSALFIFLARALDGLTAGNIPVASAVITDSTDAKDRAKGFGIIGASFGFGFVFGPAVAALTVGFDPKLPFIIAGVISLVSVIITALVLPETNKHMGEVKKGKIFDFAKLFQAIFDPNVGQALLVSLLYATAFGVYIFTFQPYSVKLMHLTTTQISMVFILIGVTGLLTQILVLPRLSRRFSEKKNLIVNTLLMLTVFLSMYFNKSVGVFILLVSIGAIANSFIGPLLQTILSKETDEKSQGTIQGLFSSYFSIGTTVGPIIGGAMATVNASVPFLAAFALSGIAFLLTLGLKTRMAHKESAF